MNSANYMKHEPADEEVQIMQEVTGCVIGVAIVIVITAITALTWWLFNG
jgi:hypothetical protein